MAIVNTYRCDGCGTIKGTLNHWFKVSTDVEVGVGGALGIYPWGDDCDKYSSDDKHFCSDACVIKAVQGWLSAQKETATHG